MKYGIAFRLLFSFIIPAVISLHSCSRSEQKAPHGNAVYYWRTAFELSDGEKTFLKENGIKTIYVKFFDIIRDGRGIHPTSTLRFNHRFPEDIEIIPTVFIDHQAFGKDKIPADLPSKIIGRVDTMMLKNGYAVPSELQIDFDWTPSNREEYFAFLKKIEETLHKSGRRLSTTVRLHQLSQPAPPVDYGALMVYNTGSFRDPDESNSILSFKAVAPYLDNLASYPLPLATALPVYSWNLLFRDNKFLVISRSVNHKDTALFAPIGENRFRARRYTAIPSAPGTSGAGIRLKSGDIIRHEEISVELLDSIVNGIKKNRPSALNRVIIYHLDEPSLNQFDKDELKKLLSPN